MNFDSKIFFYLSLRKLNFQPSEAPRSPVLQNWTKSLSLHDSLPKEQPYSGCLSQKSFRLNYYSSKVWQSRLRNGKFDRGMESLPESFSPDVQPLSSHTDAFSCSLTTWPTISLKHLYKTALFRPHLWMPPFIEYYRSLMLIL